MRASFMELRLTGGLLYGGAHNILTRRTRLCASRLGDMWLRSGRRARSMAGGRRATFLGGTRGDANVNYSSLSKTDLFSRRLPPKPRQQSHSPPPGNRTPHVAASFEERRTIYLVAFPVTCGRCRDNACIWIAVCSVPYLSGDGLDGL